VRGWGTSTCRYAAPSSKPAAAQICLRFALAAPYSAEESTTSQPASRQALLGHRITQVTLVGVQASTSEPSSSGSGQASVATQKPTTSPPTCGSRPLRAGAPVSIAHLR